MATLKLQYTAGLNAGLVPLPSRLKSFFGDEGVVAWATGGFLRDRLLGRESRDIDISIAGDPLELGRRLAVAFAGHYAPLDEERHLVRIVLPDWNIDVDLLPLKGDIVSDLKQRDYTIDAMACKLEDLDRAEQALIDPLDGRQDIERRLVRAVREEGLLEDPLRLLRGIRLATELDFDVEVRTGEMIRRHARLTSAAAGERQRDELARIFGASSAGRGVRLLDEFALMDAILPEVVEGRGVEQPKEHYWAVLDHCLETVRALDYMFLDQASAAHPWHDLWNELWGSLGWWREGWDYFRQTVRQGVSRLTLLKLTGLLHDVGKPETKSFDETGRMRFFGHAEVGAEKAGRILRRLRFSGKEIELVQTMIKAHLRPVQMAQEAVPTRRAIYRFFRDCGDAAISTLFLSLADHLASVGPRVRMAGWRQHVGLVSYCLEKRFQEEVVTAPPKLVRGDDLMSELRLEPGPVVGELLEVIAEARATGEISTREEALAVAREALRKRLAAETIQQRGED